MLLEEWDARYRTAERAEEDLLSPPTPLVVQFAANLTPGNALDLACGAGRNSIWLAENGWDVTAVDGSKTAIEILEHRAAARGLGVHTHVADLERLEFHIEPRSCDLICKCYYLQRSLMPAVLEGIRPDGMAIVIVHLADAAEETTYKHAAPGELRTFFEGWDILHDYEGPPRDPAHKRSVAEIVARKPN
jgi:SAM-dependent methyltransferase